MHAYMVSIRGVNTYHKHTLDKHHAHKENKTNTTIQKHKTIHKHKINATINAQKQDKYHNPQTLDKYHNPINNNDGSCVTDPYLYELS